MKMRTKSIAVIVLMLAMLSAPLPLICCTAPVRVMVHPCCARTMLTAQSPVATEPLLIIPAVPSHAAPRIAHLQSSPIVEHRIERSTYYAPLDTIQLRI
jgi:hypothetical protein